MAIYDIRKNIAWSQELLDVVNQSILIRAASKKFGTKPETFSRYIRNLVIEDWKKNKQDIDQQKETK